jgi:hypothetical protein
MVAKEGVVRNKRESSREGWELWQSKGGEKKGREVREESVGAVAKATEARRKEWGGGHSKEMWKECAWVWSRAERRSKAVPNTKAQQLRPSQRNH